VNPPPLGLGTNVVTTGPNGSICFGVSAPGTYTITELPQAGWTNTTPTNQTVTVAPGQLTNVLFGNKTNQPGIATICIFKFHDLDGDGVQDPNEPGLSGWQFTVNPPPLGLGTNVVTTGPNGSICFPVSAPVTYTITEVPQAGWQTTCPASQTVTASPGQAVSLSFCNRRVCGDLNEVLNTGFNQSTSTLIPVGGVDDNWRITADPDPSTTEPRPADVVATTSWPAPQPGSQWISFKPSAVPIGPAPTVYYYEYCFCLAEGFSNAQLNLSIWADDIVDTVLLNGNVIGGAGGNFNYPPLNVATTNQALFRPGTNCVTIVVRDTHVGLTGLNVIGSVSATNGMCCSPQCGVAEVCISKFNDLNGNGKQDPNEPPLPGWQFTVNPPPLGLGTNVVTTGTNGSICFGVSAPGTYTITEMLQSGWTNTTPTNQVVSVVPNQLATVSFGNALVSGSASICVFKYHDLNMNGVQDPGEPFLAGWTILVKDNLGNTIHTLTTSTNPVCVSVPAPGLYNLSELLPPPIGHWLPWSPTVPHSGTYSNVNVAPGQTVTLGFGNRKNIKIWVDGPFSPLRVVIRMTAEPGEWYQLQYRESLDPDSPWRDWGEPVQATEPEVTFEVPVEATKRQLYLRGIEKKDIR
jgi:hypothetical protein